MKSLSQSLRLFVRCSAVFLMMIAMLYASASKVYGQGWVPGGERSFQIAGTPTWLDIKPNGDFRFWDGSYQTRDVIGGNVSSLSLIQRPFEYTLSTGDVFRVNALVANSPVGLYDSAGNIKWQYFETPTFVAEGNDGYLYIYSANTQTTNVVALADGTVVSKVTGPIKWLQSNSASGVVSCGTDDQLRSEVRLKKTTAN